MASKRFFDQKGMFKLNNDKISRFDGHRSIYQSDKKCAHEPMHDSTSPMHSMPSPDRMFNKTVAYKFNQEGLDAPLHKKLHETNREQVYKDIIKGKIKVDHLKVLFSP